MRSRLQISLVELWCVCEREQHQKMAGHVGVEAADPQFGGDKESGGINPQGQHCHCPS